MSVAEGHRSRGIGSEILDALIAYAAGLDPDGIIWCHARLPAESFYHRHGFRLLDRIDLPEKGLRLRMARPLVL
jgi:GNAT superfamily N-acetyltransferase